MRRSLFIGVPLAVVAALALGPIVWFGITHDENTRRQAALQPFYTPPDPLPNRPGALLRSEPITLPITGAVASRILYVSQTPDDRPVASSGMLIVPTGPAPPGGRPVVAWAHPTVGLGDWCAPSRAPNPVAGSAGWIQLMIAAGWVVVATDYAGLGTPGQSLYLVGQSEARDVVNAVRAAREWPAAAAGSRWIAWGHSQGGHSALWTGVLARQLAPELSLVAVAAAAPAAELLPLVRQQWNQAAAWVIGPEVIAAWTTVYPDLPVAPLLTATGFSSYPALAQQCLATAGMIGLARERLGETFFRADPTSDPVWRRVIREQTPPPAPTDLPVFIAQSLADHVVLPNTTAALQARWCAAGAPLTTLWLDGVAHNETAKVAGPAAATWMSERFAGRPVSSNCDVAPPVAPASAEHSP